MNTVELARSLNLWTEQRWLRVHYTCYFVRKNFFFLFFHIFHSALKWNDIHKKFEITFFPFVLLTLWLYQPGRCFDMHFLLLQIHFNSVHSTEYGKSRKWRKTMHTLLTKIIQYELKHIRVKTHHAMDSMQLIILIKITI